MALTTFTVLPVPTRRAWRVDRGAARWAMAFAPVAGVLVGAVGGAVLAGTAYAGLGGPVAAVLAVAVCAVATRGLHLDGLADLADGLGSHRGPEGALEVMKRSDIGPFGVVTLVFALLAQVGAVARAYDLGGVPRAAGALLVAAVAGRLAVTWACRRGVPSARPDGLGALVAGTVPVPVVAAASVLVAGAAAAFGVRYAVAVVVAVAVAVAMERHAVRRLGGVTGDVLGALVELAATAALLVVAAAPG
ncbi:MAG TPA: adenosylcobinamide-GDP ribazoletransferase [Streptosporangiaceae bacterium]